MNDFWNNILRYPRFFISSLVGLILVIITPFRNLFKIPKLRLIVLLMLFLVVGLFYLTLKKMVGL